MKKKIRIPCPICGKKPKRPDTKYCSNICKGISQRGQRIGGPKIKWKPKPCLECGIIFKPHREKQKFCSQKCGGNSHKEQIKKLGLQQKGKIFSKEHCLKISENAKRRMKGAGNPMYGKKAAHGKGSWHTTWLNKKVWLRSNWELAIAEWFDKIKIEYQVEEKAFPIKYKYNNEEKEGTYRPDFYLPISNEYIEIKGIWRDDALEKYKAFLEQYPEINIKLLMGKELKDLGVINERGRYIK